MPEMKTLTLKGTTFEIVDEKARGDISKAASDIKTVEGKIPTIPDTLKNPEPLHVTGYGTNGGFDYYGDVTKSIEIPSTLPNPNSLTIILGDGDQRTYSGTDPVIVDMGRYVSNSVSNSLNTLKIPETLPNENPIVFSGDVFKTDIPGGYSYDGRNQVTINIDDNVEGMIDAKVSTAVGNIKIPTELPNPKALKITVDGTPYTYTGSNTETPVDISINTGTNETEVNSMIDAKVSSAITPINAKLESGVKNPNKLTFTGGFTGEYDGSSAKTINTPTTLPNPSALTINGTSYTGKDPVSISIDTSLDESRVGELIDSKLSAAVGPINAKLESGVKNPNKLTFTGGFTGEYDGSSTKTINTPTMLPNPNVLTLRYGNTEHAITYDGSNSREVTIPLVPTAIKNPNSLALTVNDKQYSYDGSGPVSVEIDTSLNETRVNELIDTKLDAELKDPKPLKFTGAVTKTYDGSAEVTIPIPTTLPNPSALTINGTSYTGKDPVNISIDTSLNETRVNELIDTKLEAELKDPKPLTIKYGDTDNVVEYDGTGSREITIPLVPTAIKNPDPLVLTIDGQNYEYDGDERVNITIPRDTALRNPNPIEITTKDGVISYDGSEKKTIVIPTDLPNPNALSIKIDDGEPYVYDGTNPVDITIGINEAVQHLGTKVDLKIASAISGIEIPTELPNPNALTINGTSYDGSKAVTIDIDTSLDETAINTLIDKKIPAYLPNQYSLKFTGAVTEEYNGSSAKTVAIPTVPSYLPNQYSLKFTGGVTEEYNGSSAKTVAIPTKLPNPNALTINGVSYDGSVAKTITIPTAPAYLPNQYALTINGASYNGSSAVDMTQAINSLIEDKLGVIENGYY